MALSRREFLAWGVTTGAVAAAGVVVPVALLSDDGEGSDGEASPPPPETVPAVVTLYPRVKIGSVSTLADHAEVGFSYPTKETPASLFKLGRPAAGGVGPDGDIIAFATYCTHMGCPLGGQFDPEHGTLGPCGCHFTTFDLAKRGQVVIGQATSDLPQILLEVEDNGDIVAAGTMGIAYGFRDNLADAVVVEGL